MNDRILSVTFEIDAQSATDGRFSIPAEVCRILGNLNDGNMIRLVIQTPAGVPLYSVDKELSSGREIYGPDIKDYVKAGQRMIIQASRPQA